MKKSLQTQLLLTSLVASNAFAVPAPRFGEGEGGDGGDGGDAGDGQGGGGQIDLNNPTIQSAIQAAVSEATTGLKNKNDELLGKLNKSNDALKAFDGLDAAKIKNMLDSMDQNEEAKLISEGKFEEVIQKRMDKITAQHEDTVSGLNENLSSITGERDHYRGLYENQTIGNEVKTAALKAGVLPEALDDVNRRAMDIFSLDADGNIEAREGKKSDGSLLQIDGHLLTVERFVDSLKKDAPYYFPASESGGAEGDGKGNRQQSGSVDLEKVIGDGTDIDMDAYRASRKKMSGDNYHGRNPTAKYRR